MGRDAGKAGRIGSTRLHFEEIDSTNVQAGREAAAGAEHGLVITADAQSAGRGRRGRQWSSPKGVNLYFSLLLRPQLKPEKASMLTLIMAVAVYRAICMMAGCQCGIKWPNDIVVNGHKVCGILTEMRMQQYVIDYVVVGVGINVKEQEFPQDVAATATYLEKECGREMEREQLLASILKEFEECYEQFLHCGDMSFLQAEYEQALVNRGRSVRVLDPQQEFDGIARGITGTGELLVETQDGQIVEVYAGEVSVRGIYGYV